MKLPVIPAHAGIQLKVSVKWISTFVGMTILVLILFFLPINVHAASLDSINQKVSDRFEEDMARMAAIMDELRRRNGILETKVAFGGYDTQVKVADYWVNFAAEAIAYQRVQKYSGAASLRSSLQVLAGKVLKAKSEVGKAIE